MMKKLFKYLLNILIWADQGINVILFFGDPDETVSSMLGKTKLKYGKIPWHRPIEKLIDSILERIDPNHSLDAIESDEGKDCIRPY